MALSVAALAVGSTTACATKGFVRNRVGDVNDKVESVSKSLEETQERTQKNEAAIAEANQKIVQVDQKAGGGERGGGHRADGRRQRGQQGRGGRGGDQADRLRSDAQRRSGQLQVQPGGAAGRSQGADRRDGHAVEGDPQRRLHRSGRLHRQPRRRRCTTRSWASSAPSPSSATSIKQHQIPLHRISVISYGSEKPVAPNTTRAGRAQNRRVVIRVLE